MGANQSNGRGVSCPNYSCYATTSGLARWNTSAIADNAHVGCARVEGYVGAVDNTNDPELLANFPAYWPIGADDYVANPIPTAYGPQYLHLHHVVPNSVNSFYSTLGPEGFVNKTGYTGYQQLVQGDDGAPTGRNGFSMQQPALIVTYSLAAGGRYHDAVMADNPTSYWPLDEECGSVANDFQGRNNGNIAGGVQLNQPTAVEGASMAFDGSTGRIELSGATSLQPTAALSVEGWIKTTSTALQTVMRSRWYGYDLYLQNGLPTAFACGSANPCATDISAPFAYKLQGTEVVNDGAWHHLVLTKNATTATLYVDGSAVASGPHTEPVFYSGAGVAIGRDGDGDYYYAAANIDEVAVYGYALSAARVAAHAAAGGISVPSPAATQGGSGATATPNLACGVRNRTSRPVTTSTGNFWHTFDDLGVPGRGPALHLGRTYNSTAAGIDGPFGAGWSSTYAMSAVADGDGVVTVRQENGAEVAFTPAGGGAYSAPGWVSAILVRNADATYTLTRQGHDRLSFSATGKLISQSDLNGYATTVSYNGSGQLATVTDPAGRTLSFTPGANGKVARADDPAGRAVIYGYDAAANLIDVTDVGGANTHFTYDAAHRMLTMRDPRGGVVTNRYDGAGRVDRQTDAMSRATLFDYTSVAGSTKITEPSGRMILDTYRRGSLVSETLGYASAQPATWQHAYDPATLGCTSITDPNGHITARTYDARGNVTSRTDGLNRRSTFTYDALDDLTSITDANKITATFTYDAAGNLTSRRRPLSSTGQTQVTTLVYGDAAHPGDATTLTDAMAKNWTFAYDSLGNLTRATDPLANTTSYGYDTAGRRTSKVSPRGNVTGANPATYTTTYAYNAFGDLTTVTDPLSHQSIRTYDPNRNLKTVRDPDTNLSTFTYDPDDELTSVARPGSTTLGYGYDADGNQTSQTDGANRTTSYGYDAIGRLSSTTDPLNRARAFGHDGAGNATSLTDSFGRTTTFGYDEADQLRSVSYSDGLTPNVAYTYDALGRRATMSDATGTSRYGYDSLNRQVAATDGANKTIYHGYDLADRVTDITYAPNKAVIRTYDDAGRLASVRDWLNHTTTFSYDPDSNLTGQAAPNSLITTSGFDPAERLMSITHARSALTLASFTYTRDNAGQLASATSTGRPDEAYTYSPLNQLKTVNAATYNYDNADNLTRLGSGATLGYDIANQATRHHGPGLHALAL